MCVCVSPHVVRCACVCVCQMCPESKALKERKSLRLSSTTTARYGCFMLLPSHKSCATRCDPYWHATASAPKPLAEVAFTSTLPARRAEITSPLFLRSDSRRSTTLTSVFNRRLFKKILFTVLIYCKAKLCTVSKY